MDMDISGNILGDESGHVAVETVGAFVPFLLLVISILSLVNIIAVQARMHYALTQAANTLSMYCYALELLGVANNLTTLDNKANRVSSEVALLRDDVSAVLNGIGSLSGIDEATARGGDAINRAFGWGEEAVGNPTETLQLLLNYGISELGGLLFEQIARPLVGRYLSNGDQTGNEYLTGAGVVNTNGASRRAGLSALDFYNFRNWGLGNSVLIDRNGNVKLVVEYEIEYTFGGLRLPFRPTLRITQTVITKAWLNGSGRGYW